LTIDSHGCLPVVSVCVPHWW